MVFPASKHSMENVLRDVHNQADQRLRVDSQVTAIIENVSVDLDAADDSIAVKDPTTGNALSPNADGSINVNVVNSTSTAFLFRFGEVSSVASTVLTNILLYTAVNNCILQRILVSGTNISKYEVLVNGNIVARKYTYFGNLNETFDLSSGVAVLAGQQIVVRTVHSRPDTADFNATIQFTE